MKKGNVLARFKEIYETGTGFEVGWSNLDKNGNLTVGIRNKNKKELWWLHIDETENGEIIWW